MKKIECEGVGDNDGFFEMMFGDFKPDPRVTAIDEKLESYYKATEDCDNRTAANHYRIFREWARFSGYEPDEISKAKSRVCRRLGI